MDCSTGRSEFVNCDFQHTGSCMAITILAPAAAALVKCRLDATVNVAGMGMVEECIVQRCQGMGIMAVGGARDDKTGFSMLTSLNRCTIRACGTHGVWVRRKGNVAITGCTITECKGDAVNVDDAFSRCAIDSNTISDCARSALAVCGSGMAIMGHSAIARCGGGGVVVSGEGSDCTLVRNIIEECLSHAVSASMGCLLKLESNSVARNEKACVNVCDANTRAIISSNRLTIPHPHPFDHVMCSRGANVKVYGNQQDFDAPIMGKQIKEGSLTGVTKNSPSNQLSDLSKDLGGAMDNNWSPRTV